MFIFASSLNYYLPNDQILIWNSYIKLNRCSANIREAGTSKDTNRAKAQSTKISPIRKNILQWGIAKQFEL